MRVALEVVAFATTSATACPALAQSQSSKTESSESKPDKVMGYLDSPRPARGFAAFDRPHGMAEFGFGWLTLPAAEVCVDPEGAGCSKGDTTPALEVWQLYRPRPELAFGAGVTLGLIPTQSAPRSDPEGIQRDHSRRYFLVEGITRYHPYVGENVEAWVGLTLGLVVVNDRFASSESFADLALVGPRAVTIRTEGFSAGMAGGVAVALAEQWSFGTVLRLGSWFLPSEPETDPLGDVASLTGQNSMFSLGINIGYRIAL